MKMMIYFSLTVGSVVGGWLGSLLDHGNMLGAWGLLGGTVGAFVGLWVGYKLGKEYFGL